MCRYVYSDQIIGSAFVHLAETNKSEISVSCLLNMLDNVDKKVYKNNNALLNIATRDIFSTAQEYTDFFELNDETFAFSNELIKKLASVETKPIIIEKIKRYFTVGIPKDIFMTMEKVVLSALEGC